MFTHVCVLSFYLYKYVLSAGKHNIVVDTVLGFLIDRSFKHREIIAFILAGHLSGRIKEREVDSLS